MKSGACHREHNELCSHKSDPNFIAPLTPADLWVTLIILFITEMDTYHYPQTVSLFRIACRSEHQAT